MNRLERPKGQDDWDSKAAVVAAAARVKSIVDAGRHPDEEDFLPVWNDVKADFQRQQKNLCGYCSGRMVGHPGNLDHHHPKSAVTREIFERGAELPEIVNVRGRSLRPAPAAKPGWWWRAYDWTNFVFSCERCNVAWKRDYFPQTDGDGKAVLGGAAAAGHMVLIMNPFEVGDPLVHLEFDEYGNIRGRTPEGNATIDACGLDRPSLTKARRDALEHFDILIDDLERPNVPPVERLRILTKVVGYGEWTREYAAAWRANLKRRGYDWDALAAEAAKSP